MVTPKIINNTVDLIIISALKENYLKGRWLQRKWPKKNDLCGKNKSWFNRTAPPSLIILSNYFTVIFAVAKTSNIMVMFFCLYYGPYSYCFIPFFPTKILTEYNSTFMRASTVRMNIYSLARVNIFEWMVLMGRFALKKLSFSYRVNNISHLDKPVNFFPSAPYS